MYLSLRLWIEVDLAGPSLVKKEIECRGTFKIRQSLTSTYRHPSVLSDTINTCMMLHDLYSGKTSFRLQ